MQRDANEVLPDKHGEAQRRDVGQRDSPDDHHRGDEDDHNSLDRV